MAQSKIRRSPESGKDPHTKPYSKELEVLIGKKQAFEKDLNERVMLFERENNCKYSLKIEEGKISGKCRPIAIKVI